MVTSVASKIERTPVQESQGSFSRVDLKGVRGRWQRWLWMSTSVSEAASRWHFCPVRKSCKRANGGECDGWGGKRGKLAHHRFLVERDVSGSQVLGSEEDLDVLWMGQETFTCVGL